MHGYDSQRIEELSYDCQGTSFEYHRTLEDYERFCQVHDQDQTFFNQFLALNDFYEQRWVQEEFIKALDLMRQYQKSLKPAFEKDDDPYRCKIARARDES